MFTNRKIAFIGPGVMAEAMIGGLIRQGVAQPSALIAAGPGAERLEQLANKFGIAVTTDNAVAARQADVVVLSVKRGAIPPNALVLSIVAGAPLAKICNGLQHNAVVRSMPNTPAQISEGITVWTAAAQVSEEQKSMAAQILGALGEEIYVED